MNPVTGVAGAITNLDGSAVAAGAISDRIHFQWQFLDIKLGDWVSITDPHDTNPLLAKNGATSASFTATNFYIGQALRAIVSYVDATGFTESITSAQTVGLLDVTRAVGIVGILDGTPIDPVTLLPDNSAPTVVSNISHNGFGNTSTQVNKPILNMFLPLDETFRDRDTCLLYTSDAADE